MSRPLSRAPMIGSAPPAPVGRRRGALRRESRRARLRPRSASESSTRARVEASASPSASASKAGRRQHGIGDADDRGCRSADDDAFSCPSSHAVDRSALRRWRGRPRASVPSGDAGGCVGTVVPTERFGGPRDPCHRRAKPLGHRLEERALSTPSRNRPRRRPPTPQRPARVVRRKEPATRTQAETAREQRGSAPAAQWPVEALAPQQAQELGRAASRVPAEDWGALRDGSRPSGST